MEVRWRKLHVVWPHPFTIINTRTALWESLTWGSWYLQPWKHLACNSTWASLENFTSLLNPFLIHVPGHVFHYPTWPGNEATLRLQHLTIQLYYLLQGISPAPGSDLTCKAVRHNIMWAINNWPLYLHESKEQQLSISVKTANSCTIVLRQDSKELHKKAHVSLGNRVLSISTQITRKLTQLFTRNNNQLITALLVSFISFQSYHLSGSY